MIKENKDPESMSIKWHCKKKEKKNLITCFVYNWQQTRKAKGNGKYKIKNWVDKH